MTCSEAEITLLASFGQINPAYNDDVSEFRKTQKERLYLYSTVFCTQLLLRVNAHS